ncbi:hypothetical protein AB0L70_00010 [Kribbella sp. NPDC051952]|uniref:hypothetical protein n=1 Tax=Kribbella sp. NPDC051952 TaxID=3154851 RepID=UPI0034413749
MHTSRITAALAVTALLVAGTTPATADARPAAQSCTPTWKLVDSPLPLGVAEYLEKPAVFSATKAFLPGALAVPDAPAQLEWNGQKLSLSAQQIPLSPLTPAPEVAADFDSATDGWNLLELGVAHLQVADRWHGGRWSMTPLPVSPAPETKQVRLYNVAAVSAQNAWAVGGYFDRNNEFRAIGALIEHWDGTAWQIVDNPAAEQEQTYLQSITAFSASDIWAVGRQLDGDGTTVPFAEHFDGTRWRVNDAPAAAAPSAFYGVSGSGDDVWAVGSQQLPGSPGLAAPLVEHWNGTSWTVEDLPDVGNAKATAAFASSPTDVWVTAQYGLPHPQSDGFLHWDGKSWTKVPVPGPQGVGYGHAYNAIAGSGPADIWATGAIFDLSSYYSAQIAHLSCGGR